MTRPAPDAADPPTVPLTPRQLEVLVELCRDGATNAVIGRRLYMAENTVKVHMKAILAAFGKTDRAAVVCAVLRREQIPAGLIYPRTGDHR